MRNKITKKPFSLAIYICLVFLNINCDNVLDKQINFPSPNKKLPYKPKRPALEPKKKSFGFFLPAIKLENAFQKQDDFIVSNNLIKEHFRLVKPISGGLSGSAIFLVCEKENFNEFRILKTMKEINDKDSIWKNIGFREIYFSKRLSELKNDKFLPPGMSASIFFPKFYSFGITNSLNPFQPDDKKQNIPFYVMERINGISFSDFATLPDQAKKILGYNLETVEKGVIFSILLQVSVALFNAYNEFEFVHLDTHPGNIFISTTPADGIVIEALGIKINLKGPLVKIIDFDQSEIEGVHPSPRPIYGYRPKVGKEFDVYRAENKTFYPPLKLALKVFSKSHNTDVRMMNFLIHTFKNRFLKESGVNVHKKYYNNLEEIIMFFALNARKFGL
jgi:hypothetical protein